MQPYNIRPFTAADDLYAIGVAKRFSESKGYTFNEECFVVYLQDMFDKGIILILEDEGDTIGMCAVIEVTNHFTGNKTMFRKDIWIEPEYRGKGLTNLFYDRLKEIGGMLEFKEYSWENN